MLTRVSPSEEVWHCGCWLPGRVGVSLSFDFEEVLELFDCDVCNPLSSVIVVSGDRV